MTIGGKSVTAVGDSDHPVSLLVASLAGHSVILTTVQVRM
jgi:hypothetical protein